MPAQHKAQVKHEGWRLYSSEHSRKDFTQHPHFALTAVREFLIMEGIAFRHAG
jgi:hypothetical protein